jgi:hypothetical protein
MRSSEGADEHHVANPFTPRQSELFSIVRPGKRVNQIRIEVGQLLCRSAIEWLGPEISDPASRVNAAYGAPVRCPTNRPPGDGGTYIKFSAQRLRAGSSVVEQ